MGHPAINRIREITGIKEHRSDVIDFLRNTTNIKPTAVQNKMLNHLAKNDLCGIEGPRQSGITTAVLGHLLYDFFL